MERVILSTLGAWLTMAVAFAPNAALAQTPQPFPRPGQTSQTAPAPPPPETSARPAAPPDQTPSTPAADDAPTEAALGVPIYPSAQYLGSYDAGRGQRFYLFGTASSFAEMVAYYRTTLKSRGESLFETPATYMFETARYRDETMAFPPSVTIKDYTWGGSPGIANPKPDAQPTHFPTVIQIVPPPSGTR